MLRIRFARILSCISFIVLFSPLWMSSAAAQAAAPQSVQFTTSDGFVLKGEYFPAKPGGPVVLLLHQLGKSHTEFSGLARLLQGRGMNVLAYDARGHGESKKKGGRNVTYEGFDDDEWAKMTLDIDAALKFLRDEKKLGHAPIAIVGSSIQSSTGLVYASEHPEIKALVMLSPGLAYHGIDTTEPMKRYGNKPVFIASSTEDSYSYESVRELETLAEGLKKIETLTDAGHGVAMFKKDAKLPGRIADWLAGNLK